MADTETFGFKGQKRDEKTKYSERQLVVFCLGSEEFGVDINEVNSIIKMESITKIPNAQFFIEGVINLRGKIIVVVNLSKKLGLPVKDTNKDTRIIIIETKDKQDKEMMVGMIVDHAREAIRLSEDQIEPAPPLITQKISSDYLEGVGIVGERLLILLDLAKVLGESDVASVQMAQANVPLQKEKQDREIKLENIPENKSDIKPEIESEVKPQEKPQVQEPKAPQPPSVNPSVSADSSALDASAVSPSTSPSTSLSESSSSSPVADSDISSVPPAPTGPGTPEFSPAQPVEHPNISSPEPGAASSDEAKKPEDDAEKSAQDIAAEVASEHRPQAFPDPVKKD